ncbi:UNVERIFIED_CONTAM: hypothetical protein FKN15_021268 [Acipenser sinensis]
MPRLSNEDCLVANGIIEGGLSVRSCPENELFCFNNQQTSPEKPGNQEEGELIVEGLLNISWGLRRPIRLQMHDDNERVHFSCTGPWRLDQTGLNRNEKAAQTVQKENTLESNNNSVNNEIFSQNLTNLDSEMTNTEEETPQLMRTKSDASFMNVQRRSKYRTCGEMQRIKRHRFSINGHFYNHKVENTSDEFALYLVHETGERTKLSDTEYPLISRILHGPCEKIAKIFLMETDLGEEVTYDVAQYIKFEMPLLDSFVEKLKEEEEREIIKLTRK